MEQTEAGTALQGVRLSLAALQPAVALGFDEAEADSALPDDPVDFPRPP